MRVIASTAVTVDGFLDDASPERLILSNEEDFAEVARIRAESDAILVGAETVRADNPSLATRGNAFFALRRRLGKPPHPIKATVTRTGRLDPSSRFFTDGDGPRVVFCGRGGPADLETRLGGRAEVIRASDDDVGAERILLELARRGATQLLIEGGAAVLTMFLRSGRVDRLRLAIAPLILGREGGTRLLEPADFSSLGAGVLTLVSAEKLGNMAVLWFETRKA